MTSTDRRWALVTAVVVLLLLGSWTIDRDKTPHEFPLLNLACSITTAGRCESLAVSGFWEAKGSTEYTITSEIAVLQNKVANCYLLGTGLHGTDSTTRMPKSWILYGSDDGTTWRVLDTKKDDAVWKLDESRYFPIEKKAVLKFVQLKIQSQNPSDVVRLYRFRVGSCPQF